MSQEIQRIPIIIPTQDSIIQDALNPGASISSILNVTDKDKKLFLEQAYLRRFPSLWALKYKTIKGKPTTFVSKTSPYKHRPWQRDILDDTHTNLIVQKSRQLGFSEVGLTQVLHFLINYDTVKAMYIFPRNQQMVDFSKSRIKPVLEDSLYFKQLLDKDNDSVSTKKIGGNYLFMRSGWGGATGEGTDIDFLAIDEYDRMKDNVELAFQEGLKSSPYGFMRRWSTPTIPGRGINKQFMKSDQRRYVWTCHHCGHKQILDFEKNIIQVNPKGVNNVTEEIEDGTFIIGCSKCGKELDRWAEGEWVATYPSIKETRGYLISQMDACWITADDIMRRKFSYTSKQLFYNYVIGAPYASEGIEVTDADLLASIRLPKEVIARNENYVGIVAGIDWGDWNYMAVLGIKPNGAVDLLNLYQVQDKTTQPLYSVSFFCAILRAYNPNLVVADAGFGADRNSYGYTQFPASWYSCYWTTNKDARAKTRFLDQWNENSHEVNVDKTMKIQRTLHAFKGHLIGLFPWCEKLERLALHLKNTKIMDMEEDGLVYQMATRIGPDHYVSALTYALIGVDKLTNMNIKFNSAMDYDFV